MPLTQSEIEAAQSEIEKLTAQARVVDSQVAEIRKNMPADALARLLLIIGNKTGPFTQSDTDYIAGRINSFTWIKKRLNY